MAVLIQFTGLLKLMIISPSMLRKCLHQMVMAIMIVLPSAETVSIRMISTLLCMTDGEKLCLKPVIIILKKDAIHVLKDPGTEHLTEIVLKEINLFMEAFFHGIVSLKMNMAMCTNIPVLSG